MAEALYKPSVYVETTVPSYLAAWPSRDPTRALHQRLTIQWWRTAIYNYDLFVSQVVLDEVSRGDAEAARERIALLADIAVVPYSPPTVALAVQYATVLRLPGRALTDALHVAYATVYRLDYLATWNLRHLASSFTTRQIVDYNTAHGLHVPLIVTPEYLLQVESADETEGAS